MLHATLAYINIYLTSLFELSVYGSPTFTGTIAMYAKVES